MKPRAYLCAVLLFASLCPSTNAALYTKIPGVFSTGVDDSGNPLPIGSVDSHWIVTSSPAGAVSTKATDVYYMWTPNTPSSAWINTSGTITDDPAGLYVYTLIFNLTGLNYTQAAIRGEWASDNASTIYLNGVNTGYTDLTPNNQSYASFDTFTLTNGFTAGTNTLSFVVQNDGNNGFNPSGLQVVILNTTVAVPEPTVLTLSAAAAVVVFWIRRRYTHSRRIQKLELIPALPGLGKDAPSGAWSVSSRPTK